MNWRVVCSCLLSLMLALTLQAQVYNRGVISSKKIHSRKKKPAPVGTKVAPPKPIHSSGKAGKVARPTPPTAKPVKPSKEPSKPAPATAKQPPKPPVEHKITPRKVMIFPKVLYPSIRADLVGFQTNLKGFVPVTVLFKLKKTSKAGVKITDYTTSITKIVPGFSNTAKLEITIPKTMPPGYYDIHVVSANKKNVLIASNILVAGIVATEQSFFALVQNGVVNAYPMLTIRGYGFGAMSKANYVYLNKMRLSTILSWNDSMIKLTIPYWVNTGTSYALRLRNSKGVDIPKKNADPILQVYFTYKGINANFFNAELNPEDLKGFKNLANLASLISSENGGSASDQNSKLSSKRKKSNSDKGAGGQYLTILQIKGLGFGKTRGDSKVYLNSTEARQIVSWSDTLITIKATAFRPGRYVSKVFLHPNDRRRKLVYSSRDSFYVWGRIPYKLSRIIGASYAVSLKKSELSTELAEKKVSYVYTLPQNARAELALYDAEGKNLYAKFFSAEKVQSKGRYKITYSTTDLSSGKYLLVFTVNRDKYMKIFHPVIVR